VEAETPVDEFEAKDLRGLLNLKVDHSSRPLWVVSVVFLMIIMCVTSSKKISMCIVQLC